VTNDPGANQRAESALEADAVEAVARFCRELIACLKWTLDVGVSAEGQTVHVNLSGPDRSMLLSNTAAVLNGIEYLVNKVFRTGKDEEIATIILDSENYRQLREAELKLLAQIARTENRAFGTGADRRGSFPK
jgi:predicted RNA-binding protein Jag